MLEAGKCKGVDGLDWVVVDDKHGEVFRPSKGIAGYCVDPTIEMKLFRFNTKNLESIESKFSQF